MYRRPKFVTNSSSSHSMILHPKQKVKHWDPWEEGEFGWQVFLLTTKEEKEIYMAVTALMNLLSYNRFPETEESAKKEINLRFGREILKRDAYYYVDHQSLITLPQRAAGHKTIDWEYFWDLTDYIVDNDNLVIIGGNDNDAPQREIRWGGIPDPIYAVIPVDEDQKSCFSRPAGPNEWEIFWMGWSGMKEKRITKVIKFPAATKKKRPLFMHRRVKTHDRNK